MAGTSSKTKVIGVRVPIELVGQWEATAKKAGVTVGALVLELAQRGALLGERAAQASVAARAARTEPGRRAQKPTAAQDIDDPIDHSVHHTSNSPVRARVVPPGLSGEATGFNLKQKGRK